MHKVLHLQSSSVFWNLALHGQKAKLLNQIVNRWRERDGMSEPIIFILDAYHHFAKPCSIIWNEEIKILKITVLKFVSEYSYSIPENKSNFFRFWTSLMTKTPNKCPKNKFSPFSLNYCLAPCSGIILHHLSSSWRL